MVDRLRFESLLADLSSEFVSLDSPLIDGAIDDALRRLADVLDVDRAALSEISATDRTLLFTHVWRRDGSPGPGRVAAGTLFPYGLQRILDGHTHAFASVEELPPDAQDRDYLLSIGTKSSVTVPLLSAGRVIGSLGFSDTREERDWPADVIDRLRLVAHVFASALAHRRAAAELRRAVEDRMAFETLISDLSSHFVNLDSDLIDGAIEDAQRRLVEALDVDRSTLFQFVDADGRFQHTHSWAWPGSPAIPPEITGAAFPWGAAQIQRGELVCFASVDELPAGIPDRDAIIRVGTKANVTVPLVVSGRVVGALAFAALRHERSWPPEVVNRLRMVGQVFAQALARKRSESELRTSLEENARLRERLSQENVYLRREMKERQGGQAMVMGRSAAIREVMAQVEKVAPAAATVLLLGETGTGKELIATAVHERSPRRARAMVRVNCAAIPVALIESELFGREKGAYTGALARQIGRFELADESTIFLDEIGELTLDVQVKLLRVLQEKQIERLGGTRSIDVDVRVIAATNRDLEQAIADGTFREDLYYRLNVFPIRVPPLRERADDIPMLVWAFVEELSKALGKRIESISKEHMAALQRYRWPGNIRELRNAVERAVINSTGPRLAIEPPRARGPEPRRGVELTDIVREHIRTVLERTGWRVRGKGGAAELLGLKPSTLEGRMARLDLHRPAPTQE